MNYPTVLMNPRMMAKPKPINPDRNFLLKRLIDKKPKYDPIRPRLMRPFTTYLK